MNLTTCPSERQLLAFQLGDLPEHALNQVAEHLEACPRCDTLVQQMDAQRDPLLSALQSAAPLPSGGYASGMDASQTKPALSTKPSSRPGPADATNPARYPFLRPPLRPDEIGRLGHYRVLRLLGKGGMSFVFLAEDLSLHRLVALKVMKPELSAEAEDGWKRFLREARLMAGIKHENLVTVYFAGQEGEAVYLAMELLEGESLDDWLKRTRPVPLAEVVGLARDITGGLAAVHRLGLVHRDIKPANLWVERRADEHARPHPPARPTNSRIKILDFGLARRTQESTLLTQPGTVMGTPSFMSPEQARGEATDARSDLFSLGGVLYVLCTGEQPFAGQNTMAVLTALAVSEPRPVHELNPAIPRALSDFIMQLLAKDRDKRPASAEDVLERLRQVEARLNDPAHATSAAPRAPAATPPRLSRPGRRRLMAGLAVVALGLVAMVGYAVGPDLVFTYPAAVYPSVPGAVYLSSLEVIEPVHFPFPGPVPRPHWGREPDDWPAPVGDHRVVINGRNSLHGIWTHLPPPKGGTVGLSFWLDKRYKTFNTEVSLNDGPRHCPPLTFAVYGDGRLLWKSDPVSSQKDGQPCKGLAVDSVDKLTLQIRGTGEVRGAHGVWVEPYLTR